MKEEARYNRNQQILRDLQAGFSMETVAQSHKISTHQIIRIKRKVTLDPYVPQLREPVNIKVKYKGMLVICGTMDDLDRLADHAARTNYNHYSFTL